MSLIDQRILIAAPIEAIWSYVATPALMTKWNLFCKQVSVLSTKSTGPGARRRCVGENGKAIVEEITAWLENFGYEYHVVDGPFETFRGRYRLQAVPEGTVVNWTVEYHLRGPMGGLRDVATFRRRQEDRMAESLRQLRRVVEATGVRLDPAAHARYAMQSGPDVEARASHLPEGAAPLVSMSAQPAAMRPVAIGDDDLPELDAAPEPIQLPKRKTGPLPALEPKPKTGPLPAQAIKRKTGPLPETDFVPAFAAEPSATVAMPPVTEEDTKPRSPNGLRQAIDTRAKDKPEAQTAAAASPETVSGEAAGITDRAPFAPTVPISMVAPPAVNDSLQETQTVEVKSTPERSPEPPDSLPERIPTSPMPAVEDPDAVRIAEDLSAPKRDSGEVSIWEVFGLARPSERAQAELEAVIASIQKRAESPDAPEAQATEPVSAPSLQMSITDLMQPPKRQRKANPPVRVLRRRSPRQKVRAPARRPTHR